MFVAELWCKIVWSYIVTLFGRSALALLLLRRSIVLEWATPHSWVVSSSLEWLALCLITCVLAFIQPWFTNFSRHMMITGKVILFITLLLFILFENLKQLLTLSWFWSRLRSYAGVDIVYVTAPFFSCRKHAIRCMPRIWQLPSQVGKTYECSSLWNMMDAKEQYQYSFCSSVTVAGLSQGFGTWQSLIFSCSLLLFCYHSSDSLFFLFFEWGVHTIERHLTM